MSWGSKLIIVMFLCIFIAGGVQAAEWDNVKYYNSTTETITVVNALGIGTDIAEIQLQTPHINRVGQGYQKVAQFRIELFEDYTDAFGDMEFFDLKNDWEVINRNFDYKYLVKENVDVPTYETTCSLSLNGSGLDECITEQIGTHKELQSNWYVWEGSQFYEGELTIGIFTEVYDGDFVEWIPTLFGVRIDEWAVWTEALNVDLDAYWTFDENTGIIAADSILGTHELSGINTPTWGTGKINSGTDVELSSSEYWERAPGDLFPAFNQPYTFNLWIKPEAVGTTQFLLSKAGDPAVNYARYHISIYHGGTSADHEKIFYDIHETDNTGRTAKSVTLAQNGVWMMITAKYDGGTNMTLWIDGVLEATDEVGSFKDTGEQNFRVGAQSDDPVGGYFDGVIDEVGYWTRALTPAEITQLYNSGNGIQYSDLAGSNLEVTLNYPEDNFNTTTGIMFFNTTVTDDNQVQNVSLFINGVLNETNTSNFNGTYIFNKNFTVENSYNWSILAFDNEANFIESSIRDFIVHFTAPNVSLTFPKGNLGGVDAGDILIANWTIVEGSLNLSEHIINCSLTYNNVIQFLTIPECVEDKEKNFTYVSGVNNITLLVKDEFLITNSSTSEWIVTFSIANETYNNQTIEGSLEEFTIFLTSNPGFFIQASTLDYNGTDYLGTLTDLGSQLFKAEVTITIPNVEADVNKTFAWKFTLNDSSIVQADSHVQEVLEIAIDNCSSFTNEILNFTLVDEETQVQLGNVTIETANNIYSSSRIENLANFSEISNVNPTRICLNHALTQLSNFSLDVVVRYETPLSAIEYYNILNFSLVNASNRQDITLYDLNISDSTEFQLTFTGADFLPVENALVFVDRQYISENTFKTVELPKTDYNGQTVLHLVRNDVIYNIRILKDGVILGNFDNLVAFCDDFTIGDCNIELNAFDSVQGIFNYNEQLGITYSNPEYNETTRQITFQFATTDGSTQTVLMNVTRNDIFGNRTLCSSSLTSSGGTLVCNIDASVDETNLIIRVFVNGVPVVIDNIDLDTTNYGVAGYLIFFIMAISFILMFSESKTMVLMSIGLSFAGALGLGLISGELIGISAGGIWLLIILVIGIYKLNSERPQ